jgi:hypothetical protein
MASIAVLRARQALELFLHGQDPHLDHATINYAMITRRHSDMVGCDAMPSPSGIA